MAKSSIRPQVRRRTKRWRAVSNAIGAAERRAARRRRAMTYKDAHQAFINSLTRRQRHAHIQLPDKAQFEHMKQVIAARKATGLDGMTGRPLT